MTTTAFPSCPSTGAAFAIWSTWRLPSSAPEGRWFCPPCLAPRKSHKKGGGWLPSAAERCIMEDLKRKEAAKKAAGSGS